MAVSSDRANTFLTAADPKGEWGKYVDETWPGVHSGSSELQILMGPDRLFEKYSLGNLRSRRLQITRSAFMRNLAGRSCTYTRTTSTRTMSSAAVPLSPSTGSSAYLDPATRCTSHRALHMAMRRTAKVRWRYLTSTRMRTRSNFPPLPLRERVGVLRPYRISYA